MHTTAHVRRSEASLQDLVLFFNHVGPGNQMQLSVLVLESSVLAHEQSTGPVFVVDDVVVLFLKQSTVTHHLKIGLCSEKLIPRWCSCYAPIGVGYTVNCSLK